MNADREVVVLRLGHRPLRDKRITSHIGLVSRAFGCNGIMLTVEDMALRESLEDVRERWGGDFYVKTIKDWRGFLKRWPGVIVHLTMYGIPLDEKISEIQALDEDMLIVVGAEKVPPEVYKMSSYNIAIGSQPHSEVSALAVFLDRMFMGDELRKDFNGMTKIIPSRDGKKAFVRGKEA